MANPTARQVPSKPARPKFGALVVRKGFATKEQVIECLKIQQAQSLKQALGQILVKKRYLQAPHLNIILREQQKHGAPALKTAARPAALKKQKARRKSFPLWLIPALALPVAGLAAFWVFGSGAAPHNEAATSATGSDKSPIDPAPAALRETAAPVPPPAEPALAPLDQLIRDCETLQKEGKLAEAVKKLDEYDVRNDAHPQAAENRIFEFKKLLDGGAQTMAETRLAEAKALIRQDKFQEASQHLIGLEHLGVPKIVQQSYGALRTDVRDRLAARRREADVENRRGLEELRKKYEAVKPAANPDQAWKAAQDSTSKDDWAAAIEGLSSLATLPAWKERALALRSRAHFAAGNYLGLLLDVQLLSGAGLDSRDAVDFLNKSLTRAPIDETALDVYQKALAQNPAQSRMWEGSVLIHAWRGDIELAKKTYHRAIESKAKLDGESIRRMTEFTESYTEPFSPGTPLIVQYGGPYEILTDVGPAEARELAGFLAGVAAEYTETLPKPLNPNFQFRVLYYAKWEDYDRYHRATNGQSAKESGARAYYTHTIKQLVIPVTLPPEWGRESEEKVRRTVRHEAFHQFLNCYVEDAPRWFNEGTAAFFEMSQFGKAEFNPRRHAEAQMGLSKFPPLQRTMTMSVHEWKSGPLEGLLYGQAWSFIYYMHMQGKGSFWNEYLQALIMGASREQAFEKVFGKQDFSKLEAGWKQAVATGNYGS